MIPPPPWKECARLKKEAGRILSFLHGKSRHFSAIKRSGPAEIFGGQWQGKEVVG